MKRLIIFLLVGTLTACVTQPQYQTVYESTYLNATPAIQVSDVVIYGENEEHIIRKGAMPKVTASSFPRTSYGNTYFSGNLNDERIRHIYFNTASSKITKSGAGEVSGRLNELGQVHLIGYADPRGTQQYNLDLSKRRVKSAEKYLRKKGVGVLSTEYYGEDELPEYSFPY